MSDNMYWLLFDSIVFLIGCGIITGAIAILKRRR